MSEEEKKLENSVSVALAGATRKELVDELVKREKVDDYPVYFNEQYYLHPRGETDSYCRVSGPARIIVVQGVE